MKVNAKLGGTTSKVVPGPTPFFIRPTLIIGADVSHATPGSPQCSMAAITVSFDRECARFAAAVQTNGYRVEMITRNNIQQMLIPLIEQWHSKVGGGNGPAHIYYFRDGVSEGQYSHVINQEVKNMKECIAERWPQGAPIQWTVAVCTKRHHIRFFPKENDSQAGDRNANPLPGTLVEQDVTHPFEYDFYLNAHSAIQGTARPVHYHVLLDEAKVPIENFQKMIYQFSYQYMRSTTPVSLCKLTSSPFTFNANNPQSLPSTMLTWLPTVLAAMRLERLLPALQAVRSLRRLVKMLLSRLLVVALVMVLLRLVLHFLLKPSLCCPWVTLRIAMTLLIFEPACGTSKHLAYTA